jgi:hypothetical protein
VVDLFGGQFHLPAKLHTSTLRDLHSGAGPFADKAPLQLGLMRCTALWRAGDYAKPWPRSGPLLARKRVFAAHNIGSHRRAFCTGFVGPLPHGAGRIARCSTFRKARTRSRRAGLHIWGRLRPDIMWSSGSLKPAPKCHFASNAPHNSALRIIGQNADHLPHGATRWRRRVDGLCERMEFNTTSAEVVEHGYQIAQVGGPAGRASTR